MGLFKHEAVAVDSIGQRLYLTEDNSSGGFYRFTPDLYPVLNRGLLEVAVVAADGKVTWVKVPNPTPGADQPNTKDQVPTMTKFKRGEGIWFDSGVVYVATTSDSKVHAYDTVTQRIEVIYDKGAFKNPPLTGIDNLTVSPSGDLFVCEDNAAEGNMIDIGLLTPDLTVSRFASATGFEHVFGGVLPGLPSDVNQASSELTGPIFDPSGTRLYVASQRARRMGVGQPLGAVYEITGPFRTARPATGPTAPGNARTTDEAAAAAREAGQSVNSGQGGSQGTAPLTGSALGVEVPRRISLASARRSGIPVLLTLTRPETVSATVSGRFRPAKLKNRRQRLRKGYTLGRGSRRFERSGPQQLTVPLAKSATPLLRGRKQSLRAVVEVRVGDARLQRTVLLTTR
jgi:secreted PhoX family phosphatase